VIRRLRVRWREDRWVRRNVRKLRAADARRYRHLDKPVRVQQSVLDPTWRPADIYPGWPS
jgi:hypothetical protein